VVVPLFASYTVKNGDTLASIALQAYKRATPRLLDEICKANGMRNANVLQLGQSLNLPAYHPQARQIASGAASIQ
jgi:nucleoid-associated protein YgaU